MRGDWLKALTGSAEEIGVVGYLDVDERRALRWKARNATLEALTELGGAVRRSEVAERARALGGFSAREREAPLPERTATRYANPVDHALSWALTNLRKDGLVENPQRGLWRLTNVAAVAAESAADLPVPEIRLAELAAMPYSEYLTTPEWRRTRAAALARARHRCVLDAAHTGHLEVHHNTYDRVGAELASDLAVLCHSCQRLHHKTNGRPTRLATSQTSRPTATSELSRTPRRGSIPPPGYSTPPSVTCGSDATGAAAPRRGLSRLWRVLAG